MSVAIRDPVVGDVGDGPELLSFEAFDVTGTQHVRASEVQRTMTAGAVAKALATRMKLPADVPWSLQDGRGAVLDDDRPVGEQIRTGEKVAIMPKTHLG